MFRLEIERDLFNSALEPFPKGHLEYKHGCIVGKVSLPIGAVSVVAVPSFDGSHVVFSVPFSEIKGDIAGGFFLSKIISTFWSTIAQQIESLIIPKLAKHGLPRNTVTTDKVKDRSGDVGKIKVSIRAINSWLAGKHPRLTPSVESVSFEQEAILIEGDVKNLEGLAS